MPAWAPPALARTRVLGMGVKTQTPSLMPGERGNLHVLMQSSQQPISLREGGTETWGILGGFARTSAMRWALNLDLLDSQTQAPSRFLGDLLPQNLTPTSHLSSSVMNLSTKVEAPGG